MQTAPDFRLYHSNALEVLAGLLAQETARVPVDGDWLRPDVVLVPQASMRRWLQQALAERLGICANLQFLTPGEFVDVALDANLGKAPAGDRLAPDALRWHLLCELQQSPPAALAAFLHAPDAQSSHPLKAWSLAGALADTFEKYQAWRRDWLLSWERRAPADDWQAALWRKVARGRQHRARRIDTYLRRFGAQGETPSGLPPRLFVFACQNVSPDVLQVIASQARAGTQHFYLHTPARAFWGDLARWSADYVPDDDDRFLGGSVLDDGGPNPLLAAWGQAGRDFIATLGSGEAVGASFELTPFVEPARSTLLGRLQADVLDNTMFHASQDASTARAWPRAQVDRGDASLQFHACHTRLREVQVLHDQLRALLEAAAPAGESRLQPRDIAVLAPDIDLYAPHIEAVFGGALGSARELPYTIADTSPLATAPLADAFLRLLELPLRAPTIADVLDLLAVPALAARFDIDDQERGLLQGWLEAAGARWGLDAGDRVEHRAGRAGVADDAAYTFEFALDRLLLGYASGDEADIAGVAPWPGLEGQAATTLDAALRVLALLRHARTRLAGPLPPALWAKTLDRLLDDAFDVARDSADEAILKRLRESIRGFAEGAARAGFATPVEHRIVLEHLRGELGRSDTRAPFLSGGICFGRMVPMRLIPFRVVCLLGLDEGAFPARDGRDPLNRIVNALDTRQRRTGDPSRRDADRYLFLQLFTSAGRALYLSWCGMDPRDNSRREPSPLVSELLDVAARYHVGEAEEVAAALVVRHALQPFSPAAYGAAHVDEAQGDARRFSFDPRWREAAVDGVGAQAAPAFAAPRLWLPPRERDADDLLPLERLRSALLRPQAVYLHEGLGLRLPDDEPALAEHEPLGAPDALSHHFLREAVFAAWLRAGRRPDPEVLRTHLLARALLAPGADGAATLATLVDEVAPFAALACDSGFSADGVRLPVDVSLGDRVLRGTLDGIQHGAVLRVALRADGLHGNHVLRHGFDRLLASLHQLPLARIAAPKKGDPPELVTLPPLSREQALAVLHALLALRDDILRAPLPFLPKSGYVFVECASRKGRERAFEDAAKEWLGDRNRHGEASAATQLALRGRDPFLDGDLAARERFADISTAVFGAMRDGMPFDAQALR